MRRPEHTIGALAPLVRPLPVTCRSEEHDWIAAELTDDLRLIVGAASADRDDLLRIAIHGRTVATAATSRSAAAGRRAILVAEGGRVGLDVETLDRVALNTTAQDRWLAPAERRCILLASEPLLERACRWVLKEAYGKALGLGLALPLDRLAFGARHGAVIVRGSAAPRVPSGWTFGLYRLGDTLFATARHGAAGQATPFAPAGMKPPTVVLER